MGAEPARNAAGRCQSGRAYPDAFYGVRADAAEIAAHLGDAGAVDTALHDRDKRVRIAAEKAAGALKTPDATLITDLEALTTDEDPNVVAAALASLGALKPDGVYDRLIAALERPSFRQGVAIGALRGLAAYGDARAIPLLEERTAYGTQEQERNAAVVALAQLALRTNQTQAVLPRLLEIVAHDPLVATRAAATTALGILGDGGAIATLRHVELNDSQLTVQIDAWNAIMAIRDAEALRAYEAQVR